MPNELDGAVSRPGFSTSARRVVSPWKSNRGSLTKHCIHFAGDDEEMRCGTLTQLNRTEARYCVACIDLNSKPGERGTASARTEKITASGSPVGTTRLAIRPLRRLDVDWAGPRVFALYLPITAVLVTR